MALFFGRSTLPRKWGPNTDKIDFSRVCVLWPQKHEKRFLRKSGVRERIFCISPPPGHHLCGPYFKDTARTNNGNRSPFCFPSVISPIEQIGKKKCACIVRFFVIARDRRIAPLSTEPNRGWRWVAVRKPRFVLAATVAVRN